MKLSLKFSLLILAVLVVTLGAGAWYMVRYQQGVVEREVMLRAQTVANFGEASRDYARNVLSPAVAKISDGKFVPEAQSATFVARGTFDSLRKKQAEYSFREASLNPLNLVHRADPEEEKFIKQFAANPDLKELSGFRHKDGNEYFYIARPIAVTKACLQCHDTPERAPVEVVASYGKDHGFGWKEGDVINAFTISVPTGDIRAQQSAVMWRVGSLFGVVAVLLVSLIYTLFHFLVNRRIRRTAEVMREVADNPATATRITDRAGDEIGDMSRSVNATLDRVLPLMEERKRERDSLHASVRKLLDEVSGVAEGDLTKEAEVSADTTGAIADSFNYMIEQLRKIIGTVQDATQQVNVSAREIIATTGSLAQGSETQAEKITSATSAVDQMAASIHEVSASATESAGVADLALASAREGNVAVQNTIQGMSRIRDQVQETAKRIKRLGESSQEIGQIIQLIDDIADRTSILALNASIQAAMAGEAGRGFAVVAEEVERLAVRSTDATKKIATLVKTIQTETNEAVGSMEKAIGEVVNGSQVAGQAGHALGEIQSVSARLAGLIQSITGASRQQAQNSEAVVQSMGDISRITQQTAAGTRDAAAAVQELAELAEGLRASVSTFKLPERMPAPAAAPRETPANGKGRNGTHPPARQLVHA